MANVQEKLADSLMELQKLQNQNGLAIVRSSDLTRTHLERLKKNGFLQEVMKGWYISSRPDNIPGDTTNWHTSFWYFISAYANSRFGKDWCLSPDQSLVFYSGNSPVPTQVIMKITKEQNNIARLLHNTSILYFQSNLANPINTEDQFGLNLYSLQEALIECSPDFFKTDSITVRTCLSLIPDASDLLRLLIEKGQSTKAGRLAGALRNIGNNEAANQIVNTMKSLGYDIRESDPFKNQAPIPYTRISSPYAARLKLMWNSMREIVLENFPKSDNIQSDINACMLYINAQYKQDAYHSLSIEGYKVTDDLIEKVQSGNWNPDTDQSDEQQKNAMAARGYFQAFEAVKRSIQKILEGANAADVIANDHILWYTGLFAPSVTVGLLTPGDLVGYRTNQVYIKGSMHIPLNPTAVRDAMPVFLELLKNEKEASVRAILGHFMFVYIHPYMDGNGRIGRFLMNTLLISGGYNWIVIPVERRIKYMEALEKASIEGDIAHFANFIASLIS
jgi:Fic family protein